MPEPHMWPFCRAWPITLFTTVAGLAYTRGYTVVYPVVRDGPFVHVIGALSDFRKRALPAYMVGGCVRRGILWAGLYNFVSSCPNAIPECGLGLAVPNRPVLSPVHRTFDNAYAIRANRDPLSFSGVVFHDRRVWEPVIASRPGCAWKTVPDLAS